MPFQYWVTAGRGWVVYGYFFALHMNFTIPRAACRSKRRCIFRRPWSSRSRTPPGHCLRCTSMHLCNVPLAVHLLCSAALGKQGPMRKHAATGVFLLNSAVVIASRCNKWSSFSSWRHHHHCLRCCPKRQKRAQASDAYRLPNTRSGTPLVTGPGRFAHTLPVSIGRWAHGLPVPQCPTCPTRVQQP
jgi:hypothetical protein